MKGMVVRMSLSITASRKIKLKKHAFQGMLSLLRGLFIGGLCFVVLYPLLTQLTSSVMSVADVYDSSVNYIPKHFTLEHYKNAADLLGFPSSLWNTVAMVTVISLLQTCSCTLAAYGFARFRFRFNGVLFGAVLLVMLIPPDVLMAPYFLQFRSFDLFGIIRAITGQPLMLLDTYWPFVLLGCTCTGLKNGLYIFIMRQYFRGVPKELEEAAYVDGAGPLKTLIRIILPGATSMMVTVFLFSFVWQWLDEIYTPVLCSGMNVIPSTFGNLLNPFANLTASGDTMVLTGALLQDAGIVLVIFPLVLLYIVAQRFFVQSIERSGLVG